ncbi:DUF1289 domain-containing protein [bacterium SCSIO 12696]|nr:DUF1289 domain-containing protein [bacterium SCSIO 12696]
MSNDEKPINSPCISICALDDDDVCVGCYRTADEIRGWMAMDNVERKEVLKKSMLRSRQANPFA